MHNLTLIITNALTSNHSQSFFIIIIIGGRLGDFARMLFISSLLVMIIMIIINPMINVLIMINMINHDQNRDLYQYGDHDQNGDNVMLIISTVLISTIMTIVIKLWSKWWSLEAERGGCAGDRGFSGRRATRWDAFQGSWSSLPSSPLFSSSSALLSSWWQWKSTVWLSSSSSSSDHLHMIMNPFWSPHPQWLEQWQKQWPWGK